MNENGYLDRFDAIIDGYNEDIARAEGFICDLEREYVPGKNVDNMIKISTQIMKLRDHVRQLKTARTEIERQKLDYIMNNNA